MTYRRVSKELAEKISKKLPKDLDETSLWDICDIFTGGDLTQYQLERLTQMVKRRL